MRNLVLSLVSLLVLASPRPARAQLFETVGIRAQGFGGAFVAVADDATATWWNPAGLASGPFFDALVEYDRIRRTPQQSVRAVAVAFPALGVSYYHLPINQMRAAASTGTGATGRQDSRQEQGVLGVYGLTVGQSLGAHLVVASTVKLERAGGETESDVDLGALARYGYLQLGLSVKNVRQAEFETADGVLALKRQARAGVALLGHSRGFISEMTLAADADLTTTTSIVWGETRRVAGGLEIWMFRRKLGLRGGASGNTVGAKGSSASGGVSVAVMSGAYVKTYLDAHHTNGSDTSRRGWGVALRSTF
jgi:hypothetical protein